MSLPRLATSRLELQLLQPSMEQAMIDFLAANAAHFAPWDPPPAPDHLDPDRWTSQCRASVSEFEAGSSVRLVMSHVGQTDDIIGAINFTQIFRGPFQACFLGYRIGADEQGKGLMREALEAAIELMFSQMGLHRIHANYVPANIRSGRLLARLGFVIEGYAKDYLFIDGAWRDHVLTSLTHPDAAGSLLVPRSVTLKK